MGIGTERAPVARPTRNSGRDGRRGHPANRGGPGAGSYVAIIAFAATYLVVGFYRPLPAWVAGGYLALSVLCFIGYAIDKSAAVAGRRRGSERTLLTLGLAGGWPGAIVAQQLLRHKTKKAGFRSAFWGTVVVNVLAFAALASPLLNFVIDFVIDQVPQP